MGNIDKMQDRIKTYIKDAEKPVFKEKYKKYLTGVMKARSPYKDPDANSEEFYKDLVAFLNIQERKFENKLNGKYTYAFSENPFGIKVSTNNEEEFYLKSDQFGFSAPQVDGKHPYDVYLKQEENANIDEKIDNVINWILKTRTLGGSFLWPMECKKGTLGKNPQYNVRRGGLAYGKKIINDRVDVTLFEIKQTLDFIENCKNEAEHSEKMSISKIIRKADAFC